MKNYYCRWLAISLSLLFSSGISSQNTFQKTFGDNMDDVAEWVANTSTGYIIAGYTSTALTGRDGYLLNLDFSGNVIWQKKIGGTRDDQFNVVMETPGGYFVLGETASYGVGGKDAWLLKISTTGTIQWSKTIGQSGYDDLGNSIIPVFGDRLLICGTSAPVGTTSSQTHLTLIDNNGQAVWSRTYSVGSEDLNLFRSNYVSDGIIYASGGEFEGEYDGLFAKIDLETGDILSTVRYAGNSNESLYYQQLASDGNIMLCDGTWSPTNGASLKQWVNKVTPEGQTIWSKVYSRPNGGSLRGRIESAGNGNFLLTPYDAKFTPSGDALLFEIDNDGKVLWSRNYGRPGLDWLWKSQLTADGGFISVGSTLGANGDMEVLVIKTNGEGLVEGCCVPEAGIIAENFDHFDSPPAHSFSDWSLTKSVLNQPVDATLQQRAYCNYQPVQIMRDIALCPNQPFTVHGVDYYAPDEVSDILPGLFGCDTLVKYELHLSNLIPAHQTIKICPGSSINFHGITYTGPVVVTDTVFAATACDTLLTTAIEWAEYPTSQRDIVLCKGHSVNIGGVLYTKPGIVQDTVRAVSGGCDTLRTNILRNDEPMPFLSQDTVLCNGDRIELVSPYDFTFWNGIGPSRTYEVVSTGLVIATATSGEGCLRLDTIVVKTCCSDQNVYLPNIFSPNDDGLNDTFCVYATERCDEFTLRVFDRWGDFLFKSNSTDDCWDGTFRGLPMPAGVYVWMVEFNSDKSVSKEIRKGSITLLR